MNWAIATRIGSITIDIRTPTPAGAPAEVSHLLLHFDGADGSTTFTDSSGKGHTVTAGGNAQIDTAQSVFGGSSCLFDGSGDYVQLDGSSDFAFGTGDFTVDFWVRFNSGITSQRLYDARDPGGGGGGVGLFMNGANKVSFFYGAEQITGTTTVVINQWYHIALTKASGSTRLFVNGTQEGSTWADAQNYTIAANRPLIGVDAGDGASFGLNGWIDELRVIKGEAKWTANFTPPVAPY